MVLGGPLETNRGAAALQVNVQRTEPALLPDPVELSGLPSMHRSGLPIAHGVQREDSHRIVCLGPVGAMGERSVNVDEHHAAW